MTATGTRFLLRGTGTALPAGRLDNEILGEALGMDPESIFSRTGIVERRIAAADDSASSLGARAARVALEQAAVDPAEIDLVLLSTYTPDHWLCPTAPELARQIGATRAGAFDLNAACSGGTTALLTAASLMRAGVFRTALVVTSDLTTRYVRNDDPKTRLVFGDGATAMLISEAREDDPSAWTLVASTMGADGAGADLFWVPHGGTATPPVNGHRFEEVRTVEMDGRAVFRFGVERGVAVIDELCRRAGLAPDDVAWVIPHQANLRIISALRERCAIPSERFFVNIDRYGNTASSSIPLALAELLAAGRVRRGDTLLLVAFGAGLTWCGLALRAGG